LELEERVRLAKKGDENVFYELIEERKKTLYITAYTYVKNQQDALDIVHDTVLKAYIGIKKLKEPRFFNTWLTRILINCSIDHLRKNKKTEVLDENTNSRLAVNIDSSEESLDLYNAITKLNEKCKIVVTLKYFQNLTLEEISQVLDYPLGTVKSTLHKALKELRLELSEEGDLY
jgi:RNA polymerase sigma-70 factor, ECF subfamily